jgi:hypothetical protein
LSTLDDLTAEINAQLPTNSTGQITATRLRTVLIDVVTQIIEDLASTGGLSFSGTGDPTLTWAQAGATNFSNPPATLRTTGRDNPGDYGGALYQKVSSLPAFPFPASATITTLDGSFYKMIPSGGDVWWEAFGAKPNLSFDSYQAFEDAEIWMCLQDPADAIGEGTAFTLRSGSGKYYTSKSLSMTGTSFNFKGMGKTTGGTTIRTVWNQDCIQIQGLQSEVTFGHEGGPVTTFDSVVGMHYNWPGHKEIYVCRSAGNPNESVPLTSTGTGLVSGTATFDYVRDKTWLEQRNKGCDDAVVSDFTIWGLWDVNNPAQDDEDQTVSGGGYHSGIVMRVRAVIERVFTLAFPGHGVAIVGDGGADIRGSGNVNQWSVNRLQSYYNGHAGVYVMGADANAGIGIDIDTGYNGTWGIADWCFLGNRWLNTQSALDGNPSIAQTKYSGLVNHNGYYWLASLPVLGVSPPEEAFNWTGTEPGINQYNWVRSGGDGSAGPNGGAPKWINGTRYRANGSYSTVNANCRTIFFGAYIEGGTNGFQIGPGSTTFATIGGGDVSRGGQAWQDNFLKNSLGVLTDYNGPSGQKIMAVNLGSKAVNGGIVDIAPSQILKVQDYEGNAQIIQGVVPAATSFTGSIADQTFSGASFTGQIGLGDFTGGDNAYPTVLFVTSRTGTILNGQTLSGTGIPAGTVIANDGYAGVFGWDESYEILYGSTSHAATIGPEAMTTSRLRSVLTVTAVTGTLVQGSTISGGTVAPHTQIIGQIDPTTGATITFAGGTGKYSLSKPGQTVSSASLTATPSGTANLDWAMIKEGNTDAHYWGWLGESSQRKFGRTAAQSRSLWANTLILGDGGGSGMNGTARAMRFGGAPGGGDFAHGEWVFNVNPTVGQYPFYVYCAAGSGVAGAPGWVGRGTAFT